MTTFAIRPSDNALVWVKDAPEKPLFSSWECMSPATQGEVNAKINGYESALKQSIENGIEVADEAIIINLIREKQSNPRQGLDENFSLIPGTPYHLDVLMEVRPFSDDYCIHGCSTGCLGYKPECHPHEIAYLVEPKSMEQITKEAIEARCPHHGFKRVKGCLYCGNLLLGLPNPEPTRWVSVKESQEELWK